VTHTGAGYSPTTAQDFTGGASYTVIAADSTTKTYTAIVQKAALSAIAVTTPPTNTTYAIQGSADTGINWDGISITGTDSAGNSIGLLPSYSGGATVPSGFTVAYNLTGAGTRQVIITHTASGKSTAFSVTVNSNANDITSFKVDTTYGVISGNTITVTLPYNSTVDLASVAPTVAHTGTDYSPTGAQDFTTDKTYTVTAADNTTKKYSVKVQKASLFSIVVTTPPTKTAYAIQSGVNTGIDWNGISITGTDSMGNSISMVSSYNDEMAAIPPGFAASYDLTGAGTRLVTLAHIERGKQATFSVTDNSNAQDLTSFRVGATYGVITGTDITVTLPYNSDDPTNVTPVVAHTGLSSTPTTARDFTTNQTYTVTASDGSEQSYTVTLTKAKILFITDIGGVPDLGYKRTGSNISPAIKADIDGHVSGIDSTGMVTLIAAEDYTLSPVNPASLTETGKNTTVTLTVPGAKTYNGLIQTYPFSAYIKSDNPNLAGLSLSSSPGSEVGTFDNVFSPATFSYEVNLTAISEATADITVNATTAHSKATVLVDGKTSTTVSRNFSNSNTTITIEVASEDGSAKKTYTVKLYTIPSPPTTVNVSYNGEYERVRVSGGIGVLTYDINEGYATEFGSYTHYGYKPNDEYWDNYTMGYSRHYRVRSRTSDGKLSEWVGPFKRP
jgi:hypothetical protein